MSLWRVRQGELLKVGGVLERAGAWALRGGSLSLKSIQQERRRGDDKHEFCQELPGVPRRPLTLDPSAPRPARGRSCPGSHLGELLPQRLGFL